MGWYAGEEGWAGGRTNVGRRVGSWLQRSTREEENENFSFRPLPSRGPLSLILPLSPSLPPTTTVLLVLLPSPFLLQTIQENLLSRVTKLSRRLERLTDQASIPFFCVVSSSHTHRATFLQSFFRPTPTSILLHFDTQKQLRSSVSQDQRRL